METMKNHRYGHDLILKARWKTTSTPTSVVSRKEPSSRAEIVRVDDDNVMTLISNRKVESTAQFRDAEKSNLVVVVTVWTSSSLARTSRGRHHHLSFENKTGCTALRISSKTYGKNTRRHQGPYHAPHQGDFTLWIWAATFPPRFPCGSAPRAETWMLW